MQRINLKKIMQFLNLQHGYKTLQELLTDGAQKRGEGTKISHIKKNNTKQQSEDVW